MSLTQDALLTALRGAHPEGLSLTDLERSLALSRSERQDLKDLLEDLHHDGLAYQGARRRWVAVMEEMPVGKIEGEENGGKEGGALSPDPRDGSLGTGKLRVFPSGRSDVRPDDGGRPVRIHRLDRGSGIDGDRVTFESWDAWNGLDGRVRSVVDRGRTQVTGRLIAVGGATLLEPDDPRIPEPVDVEDVAGAQPGESVLARILAWPAHPDDGLRVSVTHRLGNPEDPRTEVRKLLLMEEIEEEFPGPVLRELEVLRERDAYRMRGAAEAPEGAEAAEAAEAAEGAEAAEAAGAAEAAEGAEAAEAAGVGEAAETAEAAEVGEPLELGPARVDLRHLAFYTIDPGDARDFDDAVCVEPGVPGGDRLHVAVADVSHYVRAGSALDAAAAHRALSVYLPDRAIHMLPAALATDLCSLSPGDERLAMVVSMTVDSRGEVTGESVAAAVIRSRERLTYEGVAKVLAGSTDAEGQTDQWKAELADLTRVASALRRRRITRGGLDLDLPEAHVVLDEDDPMAVRDVRPAKPDPWTQEAYRLIEECMVAANEAVGRLADRLDLPVLWRVHDPPTGDRWTALANLAEELGVPLSLQGGPTPTFFQRVLRRFLEHPARGPLQVALLRCLSQATYEADNRGHFALAAPAYLHFTSPIRRYPDLLTHRAIKHHLAAQAHIDPDDPAPLPTPAERRRLATQCSETERRASIVERSVTDLYRAFVLRDRVGDVFDATITGVAAFGIFVQVKAPFVEGLLKREALGRDRWEVSPGGALLVGQRSGRRYRLGDPIRVRLTGVSVALRQVDFELETPPPEPRRHRSDGRSGRGRSRGGKGASTHEPPRGSNRPRGGRRRGKGASQQSADQKPGSRRRSSGAQRKNRGKGAENHGKGAGGKGSGGNRA